MIANDTELYAFAGHGNDFRELSFVNWTKIILYKNYASECFIYCF